MCKVRRPKWFGGKESACQYRRERRYSFNPCVRKIPWIRKWRPTPIFLPEKSHGWRSLAGCRTWDHKESDMTEHIHHTVRLLLALKKKKKQQRAKGNSLEVQWLDPWWGN